MTTKKGHKKDNNGGNLSEVTEAPHIIPQVGLSADLGLCKENLSEVEQQRHTTIQPTHASRIAAPRTQQPRASTGR
jgi:hypothetical protein